MINKLQQKLLNDLRHSDEDVRTLSAMTLMKVNLDLENLDTYILALKKAVRDKSVAVRYFVRRALHRLLAQETPVNKEKCTDLQLVESLTSPLAREQIAGALELGRRGNPAAVEPLLRQLSIETDCYVRSALISALGRLGKKEVLEQIRPFLRDEDPRVRANTIEACGQLEGPEGDLTCLLAMVEDEDNRVKATAAKVLGMFGDEKILKILEKMLFSEEQWLKQSALHSLEFVVVPGVEKLILRLCKDEGDEGALRFMKLLARFPTSEVQAFLKSAQRHGNRKIAELARDTSSRLEIPGGGERRLASEGVVDLDRQISEGHIVKISPTGFILFKAPGQQDRYEAHLIETGNYVFSLYKEGEVKDPDLQQLGSQIIKYEFIYTQKMEEYRKNNEGKLGSFMKALFSRKEADDDPTIKYTVDRKKRAVIDLGIKAIDKFRAGELDYPLLETYSRALNQIIQDSPKKGPA